MSSSSSLPSWLSTSSNFFTFFILYHNLPMWVPLYSKLWTLFSAFVHSCKDLESKQSPNAIALSQNSEPNIQNTKIWKKTSYVITSTFHVRKQNFCFCWNMFLGCYMRGYCFKWIQISWTNVITTTKNRNWWKFLLNGLQPDLDG